MAERTKVEIRPPIEEIRRRLKVKQGAVRNLKTPLARAAVILDQWVQKNFRSEGGEVGGWVPFKKNAKGIPLVEVSNPGRAPAKLLQDTGRLRSSFSPFATAKTAGIGSDLPYSKPHHKGEGPIPERQLLPDKGASRIAVQRRADQIMRQHISEAIRK